jgi:uncharacterized membrane protein
MCCWIYTNELKSWFLTVSATLGIHLSCIAKLFEFFFLSKDALQVTSSSNSQILSSLFKYDIKLITSQVYNNVT